MFSVDTFQATLGRFVEVMERLQVRFHLTGGITGTLYGKPRFTQDIDIVIDPKQARTKMSELLLAFEPSGFLFDEEAVRHAILTGGFFNSSTRLSA